MLKKAFNFIFLMLMIISVATTGMVCVAEEYETCEFLLNGDMEWGNASYSSWSVFELSTDIVHSGTKAAVIRTTADNAATPNVLESRQIYLQTITDLIAGQTYNISFYLRREADFQTAIVAEGCTVLKPGSTLTPSGGIKVEFRDANGNQTGAASFDGAYPSTNGEWQKFELSAKAPVGTVKATVHMRSQGIGSMYLDDLSITGPCDPAVKAEKDAYRAKLQSGYDKSQYFYNEFLAEQADITLSGANYVVHPGFEPASNFSTYWKFPNEMSTQTTEDKHSGDYALKLDVPEGYSGVNPHVYQWMTPPSGKSYFDGLGTYYVSAWVKTVNAPLYAGAFFDMKMYTSDGREEGVESSPVTSTNGEWQKIEYAFTVPENIAKVNLYVRCTSSGGMTVYFDDVEFGRASTSNPINLKTKHKFYYTDEGDITANVKFNTSVAGIESGSKIRYSLFNENGSIVASQDVTAAENTSWTFSPAGLMNKTEQYTLKAEYVHPDGSVDNKWFKTTTVYVYDRPKTFDENGNILDGEIVNGEFVPNGKIVSPYFTYRSGANGRYDEFGNAGITIVRPSESVSIELLDEIHANGMKALIQLYSSVVGHPGMEAKTIETVNLVKNHPAVLAYMLMDEPSEHISPTKYLTFREMLYYLEEGYRLVRGLDEIHPIFIVECWGNFADAYEKTGQMCDIFAIDPYPSQLSTAISGSIYSSTQRAIDAVSGERPVWMLGLASAWGTTYANPENYGSAMLRYQLYDAFMAGASAAGHYVSGTDKTSAGVPYEDVYIDTFKTSKDSGELDELVDHFVLKNSSVFGEGSGNGYQWRSWYKDNGDMYLAVMSKLAKNESGQNTVISSLTTDIKLKSSNGKFSVDGYDAVLVNGVSEQEIHSADNTVAITLQAGEVSLYKLTPAENMNYSYNGDGVPVAYGSELIANGDCENATPTGFSVNSTYYTSAAQSTEQKFSGNSSLKISNGRFSFGSNNLVYQHSGIAVSPDATYKLSFNMYGSGFNASSLPTVTLTYKNGSNQTVSTETLTLYNSHINLNTWTTYEPIITIPDDSTITKMGVTFTFKKNSTIYLDNISLRQVLAFSEHELMRNTSFETFVENSNYSATNGTQPTGDWTTNNYGGITLPAMSEVSPHSGNHVLGIAANGTTFVANNISVEYGKTYDFSVWFNAKNLTDESTYPQIFVQTSGSSAYNESLGHNTHYFNFTDAYARKNDGWYKLIATFTIPEYQDGFDITNVSITFRMAGSSADVTGYFDDMSLRTTPEKTGYTLRNLSYSSNDSAITVAYDVTNHFTEFGGTVIYAFYDASGRFIKMEKEDAAFDALHITRTFDKVDFASMKIFIWDSVSGMTPLSNIIE